MYTSQLLPNVDRCDPLMLEEADDDMLVGFPLFATFEHGVQCILVMHNCLFKKSLGTQVDRLAQLPIQSVSFSSRNTAAHRAQIGKSRDLRRDTIALTPKPGNSQWRLVSVEANLSRKRLNTFWSLCEICTKTRLHTSCSKTPRKNLFGRPSYTSECDCAGFGPFVCRCSESAGSLVPTEAS